MFIAGEKVQVRGGRIGTILTTMSEGLFRRFDSGTSEAMNVYWVLLSTGEIRQYDEEVLMEHFEDEALDRLARD
ncbi:MAG: hypothetical protein J0J00_10340 [Microbacterium sp.]|nr:hypothetical protein [Microbacterium sp.]